MQAHLPEERMILLRQISVQLQSLRDRRILRREPIGGWEISIAGNQQAPTRGPKQGWKPYRIGTPWGDGKPDLTAWFRAKAKVPKGFAGQGTFVELGMEPAREALVYLNGVAHQGLSENHKAIRLIRKEHLDKPVSILIEAYTEFPRHPDPDYHGRFTVAEIRSIDRTVHDLWWDLNTALEVAKVHDPNSQSFQKLLDLLTDAMKNLLPVSQDAAGFRKVANETAKRFRAGLEELPSESGRGKLVLAGHTHIDTAWLWTLLETRRKCGRTFSTVLSLMESFPEYQFSLSQPQQYQYTKENYPEIYAGIKKRVKEGRWDPVGAPWVEMDSNISGGEALVRQILYGNQFFEQEFGLRSHVCWLPDAFGFNWNLPQILRKSGIDIFLTTKISWSEVTQFPYTIFNWEGADGSRVIGMMPPLNYNGMMTTGDLQAHWDQIKQKNVLDEMIYSFGYGDGGGGPTEAMIETGRRVRDITGIPQCRFGTVSEYCQDFLALTEPSRLPLWNGELYLELHRGCQTSQARTKWNNRKMEGLLRDTEILSSLALLQGVKYPSERLLAIWRSVLTNQFHDILPGSSVKEVYAEAEENYSRGRKNAIGLRADACKTLLSGIDTRGEGEPIVVFNTLGWERHDPVVREGNLPKGSFHVQDAKGVPVPHQTIAGPDGKKSLLLAPNAVPSMGHAVYRIMRGGASPQASSLKATRTLLENDFFRLHLDPKGTFTSIFDKQAEREVLAKGARGNVLQMFHDEPHCWDAWDVDFNFSENSWEWDDLQSIEVVEEGPLRAALKLVRKNGNSILRQRILIYRDVPRIDFETEVDWFEKLVLLKVAFPVNVRSSHATYEIQFGAIERTTHRNTPFDRARFEVPHLRWADLSEGNYGVALANDSKYGFDTEGNVLRLSLLRAPTSPDDHADEGRHTFTYSLIPHNGDWRQGEVVRRAIELNTPLIACPAKKSKGLIPAVHSWVQSDMPSVVMEGIKKAEKGKELILRLYESQGNRGTVNLHFGFPVEKAWECDLMEEHDKALRVARNSVRLEMSPFEIRTVKLRVGA
jgi:alpha-mannosidase